ncbi:NAD-dependent epimerase/dehydratase family protein [Acidaminococcus timonensis]|uniref:NAD-dependent epimerase/dehydratase family protein n=1 Tax=Acidaminococcus timonensis TaxID=1871002 RepID=UPI0025DE427C|nr:NAD-dependent epimerase/dehydratase family protein [Acidaminococcus timonensis]
MRKILVTGGAGFIGSHVVPALLAKGDCEVVVLDNLSTGRRNHVPEGARFQLMDMRSRELWDFLAREKFQTVVHLAAQTLVPYSMEHPEADEDLNVTGIVHVLEGCRKTGVEQFIFSSSAAIYGDNQNLPLKETEVPAPTSFYGLSKVVGENYIRMYSRCFGLKHIIFRFANVYGERQGETGEGGVISVFARKIAKGEPVTIFGDGNQTRDFVYAGDLARAIVTGIGYDGCTTLNVSTNKEVSLNQLIAILEKILGRSMDVQHGPVRPGDIYASVLSHKALVETLGMKEYTDLEAGLRRTLAYFQK